jgi:hypothetical protein
MALQRKTGLSKLWPANAGSSSKAGLAAAASKARENTERKLEIFFMALSYFNAPKLQAFGKDALTGLYQHCKNVKFQEKINKNNDNSWFICL